MIHLLGHMAPIRSSRLGRGLVWALILGVIALFSFLPFGQPVVASPLRATGLQAPAVQVQMPSDLDAHTHLVYVQRDGGETSYGAAENPHHVFGYRNKADGDLHGLPSFEHELFAGLRACASLRPASARHVALAAQQRLHLRSPPFAR
ncbi:MAG: hypothetical protein FJZ01_16080 [Candidatus Sericytochromatia bacterium]|nr:hypothetical protein [Candidatus Tanganyikabacteria bacterium]